VKEKTLLESSRFVIDTSPPNVFTVITVVGYKYAPVSSDEL
jgi:hypothetical protein